MSKSTDKMDLVKIKLKIQENLDVRDRILKRHGYFFKNDHIKVIKNNDKKSKNKLSVLGISLIFAGTYILTSSFLCMLFFWISILWLLSMMLNSGKKKSEKSRLCNEDFLDLATIVTKEEMKILIDNPECSTTKLSVFDLYKKIEHSVNPDFFKELEEQKKQAYIDSLFDNKKIDCNSR